MLIKTILAKAGGLIYRGKIKDKKVALTFDDGPNDIYTEKILNILEKEGIRATFFVSGEQAEKYSQLVRLIKAKGHSIGNHSYRHAKGADMRAGLKRTEEVLKNILGEKPAIFRPPWGRVTFKLLNYCRVNKIKIVLWSLDSEDYKIKDSRTLVASMSKRKVSPGDIILLHDDYRHTVEALPEIIANLKSRGFSFATLKEFVS